MVHPEFQKPVDIPHNATPGEAVIIRLLHDIHGLLKQIAERPVFDPQAPVNCYGENLSEGIQNAIVRGQRGIHTHD